MGRPRQAWLISISIVPQVPLVPRAVDTPVEEADELDQDPCTVDDGTFSTV
jgi:hypothetical protein